MNTHPMPTRSLVAGTVIFLATLAAWLYGAQAGVDTTMLWAVSTPLVLGLFLGETVTAAATSARQAAIQTNGSLEGRVKAATAQALAERDAARTRQVLGDIGPTPVDTTVAARYAANVLEAG